MRLFPLTALTFTLLPAALLAQFGAEQTIAIEGPETMELVDLDLDGDRDMLVGSRIGLLYFENSDGMGNFAAPVTIGGGAESRAHVVDMDGNGWPDILASRELNGGIVWYRNLGTFGWSAPLMVLPGATAVELGHADIDNDGDQDPYFVLSINTLAWCENTDGTGTMSAAMSITPLYNNARVQAIDLDEDADLDLVWSVGLPEEMGWCANLGGSFAVAQSINTSRKGNMNDLDGDGRFDLISTSSLAGVLDWQRGLDAQQNFATFSPVAMGTSADALLVQDLDGDGDKDLASSNSSIDQIMWYENIDGQGSFGPAQIIAYGVDDAHKLVAGDLDGDGDPEFFAATSVQNRIARFENLEVAQLMICGRVFNDINSDGLFNGTDHGMYNVRVDLNDGRSTFTNHSGIYWFQASPGNYTVEVAAPYMWQLTSTGIANAMVAAPNGSALGRDFSLHADQVLNDYTAELTSGSIRCTAEVPYFLTATNTGNQVHDLRMVLTLDNINTFNSADPLPTSINGNTITWDFATVQPSHSRNVEVKVQMADANFMGTVMNDHLVAEAMDNGQVVHTVTADNQATLVCAFDPNDKQVLPVGDGVDHLTAMNTTLEYTVRFMNTGNAPALDVVIIDQLDADLDPATFQVLASSHTVHTIMEADGVVRFEHYGINLPDSGADYIGSQGFVRFSIRTLNNLPEGTVASNTADIHFDYNAPIVTNTVFNTLTYGIVDGIAETVVGKEVLTIVPNPVQDQTTITVSAIFLGAADLYLTDAAGRIVRRWKVRSDEQVQVNMAGTPSGVYALQLALPGEQAQVARMVIE